MQHIIIEIAVPGVAAFPLPAPLQEEGIHFRGETDHYWRTRYIEDGEEVDQDMQIDTLTTVAHDARQYMRTGEVVTWRYYVTGL